MNERSGKTCLMLVACLLGMILIGSVAAHAQRAERKVIKKVDPAYPALLQERGIEGTVRLKVTVQADGKVRDIHLEGGNPILAESTIRAVKEWRYSAAEGETTEEVVYEYHIKKDSPAQ